MKGVSGDVEALLSDPSEPIGNRLIFLDLIGAERIPTLSDGRALNAVRRAGVNTWRQLANLTADDLFALANVGAKTVRVILDAAAHANARAARAAVLSSEDNPELEGATASTNVESLDFIRDRIQLNRLAVQFSTLAAWGIYGAAFSHLAELFDHDGFPKPVPPEVECEFNRLGRIELETLVDPEVRQLFPSSLCALLEGAGSQVDLLIRREMDSDKKPTLEDLGTQYGITRERVRQKVNDLANRMRAKLAEPRFVPLRWRVNVLSSSIGVAIPSQSDILEAGVARAAAHLTEPTECSVREILLWLAGPYDLRDGWLLRRGVSLQSLSAAVKEHFSGQWLVSREMMRGVLDDLGVVDLPDEDTVLLLRNWRDIGDGWFVFWDGPIGDKAEVVFRLAGRPLSIEELNAYIAEGHSDSHLRNRLASEERFVRLDKSNHYGLRDWGMEEYSGIAYEIGERIDRAGGSADLADIVDELVGQFGVSEASVRWYATAPAFVLEDGMLRRRLDGELFDVQPRIDRVRGLYVDKSGRLVVHLSIDKDTMRGSGRGFSIAGAVHLGITPGKRAEFLCAEADHAVVITWRVTSSQGPSVGSIRAIASSLLLSPGDEVCLTFDPQDRTCSARKVDTSTLVGATGLDLEPGHELVDIAAAIGVSTNLVRSALRSRGDAAVEELLPTDEHSPELDSALSEFGRLLG